MTTRKLLWATAALAITLGIAAGAPQGSGSTVGLPGTLVAPEGPESGASTDSTPAVRLTEEQRLRRQKCAYVWRKLYPWSYAPELADFFCGEHERAGLGAMWWYSLVYGVSGSELRPRMICIGGGMVSRGLMDCSWTFARHRRAALEPLLSGSRP